MVEQSFTCCRSVNVSTPTNVKLNLTTFHLLSFDEDTGVIEIIYPSFIKKAKVKKYTLI